MKKIAIAIIIMAGLQIAFTGLVRAQLMSVPSGGNKKASVSERIGITDVTIHYDRPGVKKREGHIWGELIPAGYTDQGFGTSKAAPWRAGANENTTFEFSTDVKIEGQPLAAGTYGFFVAYDANECTLIFSKNSTSWGSFFYKPEEDVLKVKVKPVATDKGVEWLKYEFTDETAAGATVQLQWEKLSIPIKIEVDLVGTQLASFRRELRNSPGFLYKNWIQAARYCQQNKTNLEEALLWTDTATSKNFGGEHDFAGWSVKAMILNDLGRGAEADAIMKQALPFAQMNDLYQYARQLSTQKKAKEAFDVHKMNYDKHPNEFLTNFGMARGYSGLGDYKKALAFANKSLALAPGQQGKDFVNKNIKTLEEGKDIN
jgi:hypothetical protein